MDNKQYQAVIERMFDIMNQDYAPGSELARELQELNELTCKYELYNNIGPVADDAAEQMYMEEFEERFMASMER
jgi:hypothetical protein